MKGAFRYEGVFGFKDGQELVWSRRHPAHLDEGTSGDGVLFQSYSANLSEIAGSLQHTSNASGFNAASDASIDYLPVGIPRRSKTKRFSMTYVALIASAILRFPQKRLTLSQIYQVIEKAFPDFTVSRAGWKNTVRHNLSLHDCFVKGDVATNGKSCYWHIHPAYMARFSRGDFRKRPSKEMCVLDGRRDYKRVRFDAKQPYHLPSVIHPVPVPTRREQHPLEGNVPKPLTSFPTKQPHSAHRGSHSSTEWLSEYKPYPYFYLFSPRQTAIPPLKVPPPEEFFRTETPPYYCH